MDYLRQLISKTPRSFATWYNGYLIKYEYNHYIIENPYTGDIQGTADTVQDAKYTIDEEGE